MSTARTHSLSAASRHAQRTACHTCLLSRLSPSASTRWLAATMPTAQGLPDQWHYPFVEASAKTDATEQLPALLHVMGQPGQSNKKKKEAVAALHQKLRAQLRRYRTGRPGGSAEEHLEAYKSYKAALEQGGEPS